jgi:hypothetical protein
MMYPSCVLMKFWPILWSWKKSILSESISRLKKDKKGKKIQQGIAQCAADTAYNNWRCSPLQPRMSMPPSSIRRLLIRKMVQGQLEQFSAFIKAFYLP